MSDANPATDAGAGAEALLGLAAQAGQAGRLPSLASVSNDAAPSTRAHPTPYPPPYVSHAPSFPLPNQPQPPATQTPHDAHHSLPPPLPPPASFPSPPALSQDRLPTLSEWADPSFRPYPRPFYSPVPHRWPDSELDVNRRQMAFQYHSSLNWVTPPCHNPQYYYLATQNVPYPYTHPAPLAQAPASLPPSVPNQSHVAPLPRTMHAEPPRESPMPQAAPHFRPIPQPHDGSNRDPLLELLTSEAAAAPEKKPPRAGGLAHLMNPTDTMPGAHEGVGHSRMDVRPVKPENIEKIIPVTVPSVPSVEPHPARLSLSQPRVQALPIPPIIGISAPDFAQRPTPRKDEPVLEPKKSDAELGAVVTESTEHVKENDPYTGKAPSVEQGANDGGHQVAGKLALEDDKKLTYEAQSAEVTGENAERENDKSLAAIANGTEARIAEETKDESESGDAEVTRCPCGSTANSGTMIACDQCNTWQHSRCMGFRRSTEVPDKYFCHVCRPESIRQSCIAHPKYKDRTSKDRISVERRDHESQFSTVKPVELRKLFAGDMRQRKALTRSKNDVFLRYAGHLKSQYSKYRQSVIDGLCVLLDMERAEVIDKLDAAVRQLKLEKSEEVDKTQTLANSSSDLTLPEAEMGKSHATSRKAVQKRPRPASLSIENLDVNGGAKQDSADGLVDSDFGVDAFNARNMSREERKLQQTMKLFARMEERAREKKKPRTGDSGSSPRVLPPGRCRMSKPSSSRTISPKPSAPSPDREHEPAEDFSECRERRETDPVPPTRLQSHSADVVRVDEEEHREELEKPKLVAPVPVQKSPLPAKPDADVPRKDRDQRRERVERLAPKRKESSSPDNANTLSGRRRNILSRERSQESKRRRTGSVKDLERRGASSQNPPKREQSLDFAVLVPGPSVIGSEKIVGSRLSSLERERLAQESGDDRDLRFKQAFEGNRKEKLLMESREKEMAKLLNGGKNPSPMKKRYYEADVTRAERQDDAPREHTAKREDCNKDSAGTLSVTMVVVSEKGSLPDRGQILESSRLVLPDASVGMKKPSNQKAEPMEAICIKKRPIMLIPQVEDTENKKKLATEKMSDSSLTVDESSVRISVSPKKSPPSSPAPVRSLPSPGANISSPKLRSSPIPVQRSPSLRSVPVGELSKWERSPSPLPSFKAHKITPSANKLRMQSPEKDGLSIRPTTTPKDLAKEAASTPVSTAKDCKLKPSPEQESRPVADMESKQRVLATGSATDEATWNITKPANMSVPPPLRSIRSVPAPATRKADIPSEEARSPKVEAQKEKAPPVQEASLMNRSSGGPTMSDFLQQRLQGFLGPSTTPNGIPLTGRRAKLGPACPYSSPSDNSSPISAHSAAPMVRGSTAKLGAARPLSSRTDLRADSDTLRKLNGLSPRVSGAKLAHPRGQGLNFRSTPPDVNRHRSSMPSFPDLHRRRGLRRGGGMHENMGIRRPGGYMGADRHRGAEKHSVWRLDAPAVAHRSGVTSGRPVERRERHLPGAREDEKNHIGRQRSQQWSRSPLLRKNSNENGIFHPSSAEHSSHGGRRGPHTS